ncbi:MAG: hypothetical protein ACI304_04890 [Lepagella sp.]
MNKIVYSLFALVFILLGSPLYGQVPSQFEVTAPNWSEVGVIVNNNAKTAKVYKWGAATSTYFVYKKSEAVNGLTSKDVGYWGTTRNNAATYVSPQGGCPVVKKTPGWVELYQAGPKGENGWVESKYVSFYPKIDITSEIVASEPTMVEFYNMIVYLTYNAEEQTATAHIGKLRNGILIFPYSTYTLPIETKAGGTAEMGSNDDYDYLILTPQEMVNGIPVVSRFPSDLVAKLLDIAVEVEHPMVILQCEAGILTTSL